MINSGAARARLEQTNDGRTRGMRGVGVVTSKSVTPLTSTAGYKKCPSIQALYQAKRRARQPIPRCRVSSLQAPPRRRFNLVIETFLVALICAVLLGFEWRYQLGRVRLGTAMLSSVGFGFV